MQGYMVSCLGGVEVGEVVHALKACLEAEALKVVAGQEVLCLSLPPEK